MKTIRFNRRLPDGSTFRLGTAYEDENGWKFYPGLPARRVSRKRHATLKACLPRWLGYPDNCESEEVTK